MMVWTHVLRCLKFEGACSVVTVARADGSTPREAGTRMVVHGDSSFYGTIGGGTLELEAIRLASSAARVGVAAFCVERVSLGPDLGQCCGGRVDIAIETVTKASIRQVEEFAAMETAGTVFATEATFEHERPVLRRLLKNLPSDPVTVSEDLNGRRVVVERYGEVRRQLYLFGAGHVGRALVLALAPHPFDVTWIDGRRDQFPERAPANVRLVHSGEPAAELKNAPDNAFILAVTHSHALDEDIMARALLEQKFAYCGVIGSKTKRARFQRRLKAQGLSDSLVSSMICPVGVTTIRSKHPAAIAAGIVVDLLGRHEAHHFCSSHNFEAKDGVAQIIPHGQ